MSSPVGGEFLQKAVQLAIAEIFNLNIAFGLFLLRGSRHLFRACMPTDFGDQIGRSKVCPEKRHALHLHAGCLFDCHHQLDRHERVESEARQWLVDIQRIVRQLKARNIGILITDHNVRETLGICDRAYIMNEGSVLTQGAPADVLANEDVRNVYLGREFRM